MSHDFVLQPEARKAPENWELRRGASIAATDALGPQTTQDTLRARAGKAGRGKETGKTFDLDVHILAAQLGTTKADLLARNRTAEYVERRRIVAKKLLRRGARIIDIARAFGQHHTTILNLLRYQR